MSLIESLLFELVKSILFEWQERHVETYFKLIYQTSYLSLGIETDDLLIARSIARSLAPAIAEDMIALRGRDEKYKLLRQTSLNADEPDV